MGPVQAVTSGFSNIVNFAGRASRPEFWWWMLFIWIIQLIVSLFFGRSDGGGTFSLSGVGFVLVLIFWLATIAVGCRRLHDTGKSGWLQLLALIPCVGVIILIVFWVMPGTAGDNTYGPPPSA